MAIDKDGKLFSRSIIGMGNWFPLRQYRTDSNLGDKHRFSSVSGFSAGFCQEISERTRSAVYSNAGVLPAFWRP